MSNRSETLIGKRRQRMGYSALEFARLLQAQIPDLTESRLFRIETGRSKPTSEEREAIARLLNVKPWEVQL